MSVVSFQPYAEGPGAPTTTGWTLEGMSNNIHACYAPSYQEATDLAYQICREHRRQALARTQRRGFGTYLALECSVRGSTTHAGEVGGCVVAHSRKGFHGVNCYQGRSDWAKLAEAEARQECASAAMAQATKVDTSSASKDCGTLDLWLLPLDVP